MALEQTWRWFGPNDPITLNEIKQTGATGIVSALHQIPTGDVWPVDEIKKRKNLIENDGLSWSVVESLPVHEDIKKRKKGFKKYIDTYIESLRNLGECGVDTICYNFMPVLDWTRTGLNILFDDGTITTNFELKVFAAFDLFILKRKDAEKDYTEDLIKNAEKYFKGLNEVQKNEIIHTILFGLPGSGETFTITQLKEFINEYKEIDEKSFRQNLFEFLKEIIPASQEAGIFMAIHPDDPPKKLLGLPRIVSNKNDIGQLLSSVDLINNGLTFCTGSLGAGKQNDLVDIAKNFSSKINFIHLRNVTKKGEGDFIEDNHLGGDVDMFNIMKLLVIEQKKRIEIKTANSRMPMRPDHGHLMLDDQHLRNFYPGYSLYGRMKGLAELRGLELGILNSINS
ncbi:MAG: mannonate dehydratase [Ignavibacteriaceae bacterium]